MEVLVLVVVVVVVVLVAKYLLRTAADLCVEDEGGRRRKACVSSQQQIIKRRRKGGKPKPSGRLRPLGFLGIIIGLPCVYVCGCGCLCGLMDQLCPSLRQQHQIITTLENLLGSLVGIAFLLPLVVVLRERCQAQAHEIDGEVTHTNSGTFHMTRMKGGGGAE